MTTSSRSVAYHEPTYSVAISLTGPVENCPRALGDGLLPVANRERERHQDVEGRAGADRAEDGARDGVVRVARLLAERRGRLEAHEQQDPQQDAAQHAPARDAEQRRLARVEHRERHAVLPALADDHDREDHHRDERHDGERQHRADGDPDADVVQEQDHPERERTPQPPLRP